jgi:hypothetical protein
MKATNILVLNPIPISNPNRTNQRHLPVATARIRDKAAISSVNDNNASGSLPLSMATLAGMTAKTKALILAAVFPKIGLSAKYKTAIAAVPKIACGKVTDHLLAPNTADGIACTQNDTGGLSTMTSPILSKEPKKKLPQLLSMEATVAV